MPDGRAICYRCVADHQVPTVTVRPTVPGKDPALAQGWVHAVVGIMRDPIGYLGAQPYVGSIRPAMLYGLVFCLVGAALSIMWMVLLNSDKMQESIATLSHAYASQGMTMTPVQLRLIFLSSIPIAAVIKLLLGGALLHMGVLLAGGRPTQLREQMRIFALSTGVLLLAVVPPPFSIFLIAIVWGGAMMKWLHARYGLGPFRSMFAVLPALLMIAY